MQASVSAHLVFFAASIACAAYLPSLETHTLEQSTHIDRYPTPLLFPFLSSFPSEIFLPASDNHHNIAVHTALSTTSIISAHIKSLGKGLGRGIMMLEEEESFANGLAQIAEAYEEGWQSGNDDDEDDSDD